MMVRPQIQALDLTALLEAAAAANGQQKKDETPEERLAGAKASLERLIDASLNGCADLAHRPAEEAAVAFVKSLYRLEVLPEPVADAVVRVLVGAALHGDTGPNEGMRELLADKAITTAILVSAATLRVAGQPDTAGIPEGTGVYL